MKGDFSRVSFDPRHHFSQVLLQQGRVTLDADPNEQGAILLHYLRTLALDLFGPYAAPAGNPGFGLALVDNDGTLEMQIGAGRYYVQGMLCESDGCNYLAQPHYAPADGKDGAIDPLRRWLGSSTRDGTRFWVYLQAWERHVSSIEMPHLREVALGGPDTCSRSQVVWQVRAIDLAEVEQRLQARIEGWKKTLEQTEDASERARLQALVDDLQAQLDLLRESPGQACAVPLRLFERDAGAMTLRLQPPERLDDPCVSDPDVAYRGSENHLYRVEIHRGSDSGAPTFKWSRDNGSVLTRWVSGGGTRLRVASTRGFADAQWVELSDEDDDLLGRPGALCRLASIDGNELVLASEAPRTRTATSKVRRWDQAEREDIVLDDGAVPLRASSGLEDDWIDLEDGLQVRFEPDREYRSGDYWYAAVRTTGDTGWPQDQDGDALAQAPHGPQHRHAPLGFVGLGDNGAPGVLASCSCTVYPTSTCGVLGQRMNDAVTRPDAPVAPVAPKPVAPTPVVTDAVAKTRTVRKRKDG